MLRGGGNLNLKKQNNNFTLSEVLITLVIVGIIAAITAPLIVSSYQRKILASQFKKMYSTTENAINFVNSQTGTSLECYRYDFYGNTEPYYVSECSEFWTEFLKQLNIIKVCEIDDTTCRPQYKTKEQVLQEGGTQRNQSCSHPINQMKGYVLNDGSIFYIYYMPTTGMPDVHVSTFFGIDVNGVKGPNKWGYDLFYLNLNKKRLDIPTVAITAVCELIEKGGQSAESLLTE